jgi:hypothetical protein
MGEEPEPLTCEIQNLKCLKAKIKRDEMVDLERTSATGRTSLHYAVEAKDIDLVSKMVMNSPSYVINTLDGNGNSALHLAVFLNQKEILEILLQYDPDIDQVDRNGETALDIAMANENKVISELLLSRGAKSGKGKKSNNTLWVYAIYIVISIGITIWVARTLSKNGRFFLVDAFHNEDLADSVNHLLVVGFYLINFGYITMALKIGLKPVDAVEALEILSSKIGLVILILGGMHFFNLYLFGRLRKRTLLKREMDLNENSTPAFAKPKK